MDKIVSLKPMPEHMQAEQKEDKELESMISKLILSDEKPKANEKMNKLREKRHKKYLENKDDILEARKKYYIENKDKIIERQLKYYNKNKTLKIKNKPENKIKTAKQIISETKKLENNIKQKEKYRTMREAVYLLSHPNLDGLVVKKYTERNSE